MFSDGDLVLINKHSFSLADNDLVAMYKKSNNSQICLFTDYSLLGVIVEKHEDMCYVYLSDTEEYKYLPHGDLKLCQEL